MIIHGLHHHVSMKRLAAGELARQARHPSCDPRTAYEKGVEAERLALESEEMCAHAKANEEAAENLNKILHYLAVSKHKSRYRSLAITAIEDAQNWLLRENGTPEPERNFQALHVEGMPVNGQASS